MYRDTIRSWRVADLLILNPTMPRSLASCYAAAVQQLDALAGQYRRSGPAQQHAPAIQQRLRDGRIGEIFQHGLHEFITVFIADNNRLGALITEQYLK